MAEEFWIAVIGIFLAIVTFAVGLWQYGSAQRWKRLEFIAAEMKLIQADPKVQTALKLLDWNSLLPNLLPLEGPAGGPSVITDEHVQNALIPHIGESRKAAFTPWEYWVRDIFDALFDHLERLHHYIETGLVKAADVKPYVAYWVSLLVRPAPAKKGPAWHDNVGNYLDAYYSSVRKFLEDLDQVQIRRAPRLTTKKIGRAAAEPVAADSD